MTGGEQLDFSTENCARYSGSSIRPEGTPLITSPVGVNSLADGNEPLAVEKTGYTMKSGPAGFMRFWHV